MMRDFTFPETRRSLRVWLSDLLIEAAMHLGGKYWDPPVAEAFALFVQELVAQTKRDAGAPHA